MGSVDMYGDMSGDNISSDSSNVPVTKTATGWPFYTFSTHIELTSKQRSSTRAHTILHGELDQSIPRSQLVGTPLPPTRANIPLHSTNKLHICGSLLLKLLTVRTYTASNLLNPLLHAFPYPLQHRGCVLLALLHHCGLLLRLFCTLCARGGEVPLAC